MNKELLKSISLLYVEDDNDIREFTAKALKSLVYNIILAVDGEDGLKKMKENLSINIVLTDINMPKMNGLEMCEEIRKYNKDIPIVITSAHRDSDFFKKAIEVGVTAYALKPIDLYQLINSLVKAIEPIFLRQKLEKINNALEHRIEEAIKEIKSILDAQDNIVFVATAKNIMDVNKKFLHFFNVNTLEDFNSKNKNIYDYFKKEIGCFNIDLVKNNSTWIKYVANIAEVDRIVQMTNKQGINRVFTINIDEYNHKSEHYVISLTDITKIKEKSNLLEYQASHDSLTGLHNRKKFYEIFGKEVRRDARYNNYLSLILFDIDNFKSFNDDFGHNIGDEVLRIISKIILENIREQDIAVRWGGEEFIILTPETNIKGAYIVSEKIRSTIQSFKHEKIKRQITISGGITSCSNSDSEEDIIERADIALYKAKKLGKNNIVLYEKS